MEPSEIAVIAALVPVAAGDTFATNRIPLHLTVLSNARLGGPADAFTDAVERVASEFAPLSVTAQRDELFGPNGDIAVTETDVSPALRSLHDRLAAALLGMGGQPVVPEYWADGYRAHVTKAWDGSHVSPGDVVQLDRLVLIDCTEPVRRVVSVAALAGSRA